MNFAIVTLAIGAVVLMTTAVITWPRRHTAYWIFSFLGLATAVSIWLIGYALELSVPGNQNLLGADSVYRHYPYAGRLVPVCLPVS